MDTSFLLNITLLLSFGGIVVAFIFFLLTQQRTLATVRPLLEPPDPLWE